MAWWAAAASCKGQTAAMHELAELTEIESGGLPFQAAQAVEVVLAQAIFSQRRIRPRAWASCSSLRRRWARRSNCRWCVTLPATGPG